MDVRKVRPGAGAEWLLGGFALLRRSPLGLGLLGAIFGVLAGSVALVATRGGQSFVAAELVMLLLGPLLVAGMVHAAREVDEGRAATPGQLLQGLREGKAARLLATLLPQIGAAVLIALLVAIVIGPDNMQQMAQAMEKLQGQANPDPELMRQIPAGRVLLLVFLAIVIGVGAGFFTFLAVPDMMFTEHGAFAAMGRSFRACVNNIPALIVFYLLLMVSLVALLFAVNIIGLVVRLLAGDQAMQVVVQVLLMAVLMPVLTGAMYHAWKSLLGGGATQAPSGIEV
jgi:hypothetical protein